MTAQPDPLPEGPLPEESLEEALEVEGRRYPSTIGGLFYICILVGTVVGIGIAWAGDWRLGVRWIGGALLAAAVLRLLLRQRDAGMLAVRHRIVDVLLLAGVGTALFFLAGSIPNQPV